jgi:hypothetical protein
MRFARAVVATWIAGIFLVAGCSSVQVTQDYDPATDFAKLRTYGWLDGSTQRGDVDQLTAERIVRAVDAELAARGFAKAEAKPDFLIHYLASVAQRIESRPTTVSAGYGWRHGYAGVASNEIDTYDEGTLVLDVIDPATKNLLWRGTAKAAVQANRTPDEREARIREVVRQILAQFPPTRA